VDGGEFSYTRRHWVVTTPTPSSLTLAEELNGAMVDITIVPTNLVNAALRKANRPIACWKLQGQEIEVPPGEGANDLHPETATEKIVTALKEGDRQWKSRRRHAYLAESSS